MPRPAPPQPVNGPLQVQRALYHRCRRGEPEALATLLYRLVDRLYTAASFVAPDEPSAMTAVVLTWEDLLALLRRPRVGGYLQDRAFRLLAGHLLDYSDRTAIRRQLRNAAREPEESLLALPEEQLAPLLQIIPAYAEQIALNHRERSVLRRRGSYALGGLLALIIFTQAWLAESSSPPSDLQLTCLKQRIERAELIDVVRDCLGDLPDPDGADRLRAHALQRVSLVLEEVANARSWRDSPGLRYLVERVQQEGLAEELAEVTPAYEGAIREDLLHTQLVLEEVQNL